MKWYVAGLVLLFSVFAFVACQNEEPASFLSSDQEAVQSLAKQSDDADPDALLKATVEAANAELEADGKEVRIGLVEYYTSGDQAGRSVFFFHVGNKQLAHHWVPGDPRRGGNFDITWANDLFDGATGTLTAAQTDAEIQKAMMTWQNVTCSEIPLTNVGSYNFDFGYVQWLLGFGGVPGWAFDLTHAGWLPGAFFDAIAPGGSGFILGVTFTFIWVDANGPTDIDNNGKLDVAFREIYYNGEFPWNVGSTFDVETVALHEAGHGLSQAHFGKAFRTTSNGKLHFAPRAVMNAAYSGVQTEISETDNAGHCSIWASWPNN